MDKEHYTNLHWGDWFKDTAVLRLATRGLWIDIIGVMATRQSDRIHSQFERLPFVLRATMQDIMLASLDLAENDAAEVLVDGVPIIQWRENNVLSGINEMDWITNSMAKAWLTIICRRRSKELEIKHKRSEAGKLGMAVRYQKDNKDPNKDPNKGLTTAGNGNGNGNGTGVPEGGMGETDEPFIAPPSPVKPFTPEEFAIAAKSLNVTDTERVLCWAHYDSQDWVNGNGKKITGNPQSILISWMANKREPIVGVTADQGKRQAWQVEADIAAARKIRVRLWDAIEKACSGRGYDQSDVVKHWRSHVKAESADDYDRIKARIKELEGELVQSV